MKWKGREGREKQEKGRKGRSEVHGKMTRRREAEEKAEGG